MDESNRRALRTGRQRRRRVGAGVVSALVAGALAVVGPAQPANGEFTGGVNTSWASTDIRTPLDVQIDPAGEVPVGAWLDEQGKRHISRAYFTFGTALAELAGRHIYAASVHFFDSTGTGCEDRQLDARATAPVTAETSWISPPEPLSDPLEPVAFDPSLPCPGVVTWHATDAVLQAVSTGEPTLTVELQVPRQHMANLDHGRRFFFQAVLDVEYEPLPLPRPQVSSPDYPEQTAEPVLGARIPGEFTFDAEGNTDAVGFQWTWDGSFGFGDPFQSDTFVFADAPGGTATLHLAPPDWGVQTLSVRSVRADAVTGGVRRYEILVRNTAPLVSWDQEQVAAGVPLPISFTPVVDDVVSYEFVVEVFGGPEVAAGAVPAGPDGTATALIIPPAPDIYFVRARSAHPGWISTESRFLLSVP